MNNHRKPSIEDVRSLLRSGQGGPTTFGRILRASAAGLALSMAAATPAVAADNAVVVAAPRTDSMSPKLAEAIAMNDVEMELKWADGQLVGARVRSSDSWSGELEKALATLLAAPESEGLRELRIGHATSGDFEETPGEGEQSVLDILASSRLPMLQTLLLGDYIIADEMEISWVTLGDVSRVFSAMPNLKELTVQGGGLRFEADSLASLSKLESLTIRSGGLGKQPIEAIAATEMPRLRTLEIWFGDEEYGAQGNLAMIQPILDGTKLPKIRNLGLKNAMFQAEIIAALPGSGILPKLSRLDIGMGAAGPEAFQVLIDHADQFKRLYRLDVSESFLVDRRDSEDRPAARILGELRSIYGERLVTEKLRQAWDDDGYYVSVAE